MSNPFFDKPILNSPYDYPGRHWELDETGQPTQKIINSRRTASFVTPIPKPRKRKGKGKSAPATQAVQGDLFAHELSTEQQKYDHTALINAVRREVDKWRRIPNPNDWRVTPETARLLYAAAKAIGPKQLTEEEARDTARRAYSRNTRLSSADIGKAVGRADGPWTATSPIFGPPPRWTRTSRYSECPVLAFPRTGLQNKWG